MATDFKSIPIIDIAPLLAKCDDPKMAVDPHVCEVVRQLDRACREAGFFYVKGHGIPETLVKEVRNVTRKFFDLPYEEKLKIKMTPAAGYRGYQRIGENITKGVPDMHEAIDCYKELKQGMYGALGKPMEGRNQWPHNPPNFKELMEEYIGLCTELSRKIMRGIALALGGLPNEFEGERGGDAFWVMRLIGYPGASTENQNCRPENDIGCGAHTDYGLLTLVNQDENITALQLSLAVLSRIGRAAATRPKHCFAGFFSIFRFVNQIRQLFAVPGFFPSFPRHNSLRWMVRNQSGEWISAPPIPGTFVCNIGDMLKILSNGLYESTLHRVINTSPKYRVCVAFFYEPNYDAAMEPLEVCVQRSGGTRKFEKAVYGEHLVSKVSTNFVM